MALKISTVKSRIILVIVAYSTIVAILVSSFSFYLMYIFQRKTMIKSAEFNLQLVAGLIQQDLQDLSYIGNWCGNKNSNIENYFTASSNEKYLAIKAFNDMQDEYRYHSANAYIQRLIVVDDTKTKILQICNASSSQPINVYTIDKIKHKLNTGTYTEWQEINNDFFFNAEAPEVLEFIRPVLSSDTREVIGTVYLTASSALVTDKLKSYSLAGESKLYLNMEEKTYLITDSGFDIVDHEYIESDIDGLDTIGKNTRVFNIRDEDGSKKVMVSYPVRNGITISQTLSTPQFYPLDKVLYFMLLGICLSVLLLALLVIYILDKRISRPVAKIRKKIKEISEGDFSPDPDLEYDDELGQVGKGINDLSHDVVSLMESRIADEKNKKDLEYRMLQSQINPHFLYNTLNSIKWMAMMQGSEGISEMTTALSKLLRKIAKDIRKTVPLREELELLDEYMIIQKYRYADTVSLEKQIEDEKLLDIFIPRFLFQPLVENAIFHGLEPKGGGSIILCIRQQEDEVICYVTDNGVGMSEKAIKEALNSERGLQELNGLGLRNVDERLRSTYGESRGLKILSKEGEFTQMLIRIPLQDKEGMI